MTANSAKTFILGVIYRHPKGDVHDFVSKFNDKLLQINEKYKSKYYILGDININVNPSNSTEKSASYLNMISSNGAHMLIDKPTRISGDCSSIIDHIITNDCSNLIYPCVFLSDLSDHFPVACFVASNSSNSKSSPRKKLAFYYRDIKRFDKDLFATDLCNNLELYFYIDVFESAHDVDLKFSNFVNIVSSCINQHAPLKKASRRKSKLINKPWITKGILISIRRKQKLYINCYKNGSDAQKILYKIYSNKLTKIKTFAKKLYLQTEIVNSSQDMRKFWGIMKTLLPNKPLANSPDMINVNGSMINNPVDIAENFNKYFCGVGRTLANNINCNNSISFKNYMKNRVSSSMFLRPTCATEILRIINQMNLNKSCGSDGINAKFIIFAAEVLAPVLALLFNACFDYGLFPSCLKIAKVVPIYKSGDKSELTNYRPISLLSTFSKILEKVVYTRTINFLNLNTVLSPSQYGFRSKFSTLHAILDITTSTFDSIENKLYTGLVLLDLAKAFDTVNHTILHNKLDHYGIRGIAKNFFQSYLSNRSQFVCINNANSSLSNIEVGVPQGSTLGPLLFLLYINDLSNSIDSTPRLFADDTCLVVNAPSTELLEQRINHEFNGVSNWMIANKLTLNANKSQALIISPKLRSPSVNLNLRCPAGQIKIVNKAKYLGVILDNKLNFHEHAKYVEAKLARSVGILSKLKFFLPQTALLKLYYSLVHSHLTYGLTVWGTTYPTYLLKLNRIQNKAIRTVAGITGKAWCESVSPLYSKLGILPLEQLAKYVISKFVYNHRKKSLPPVFDNYFTPANVTHSFSTRFSSNEQLKIPFFKTKRTQRSIKFIGAKIWNVIPPDMRKYSSSKFQKEYKNYLLKF